MRIQVKSWLKIFAIATLLVTSATSMAADQKFGADRHVAKGINCPICHGEKMNMKDPVIPDEATCMKCHDKQSLAAKTNGLPGVNPHRAPHNDDCTLCHMQHQPAVDYCAQCHKFDFKVK